MLKKLTSKEILWVIFGNIGGALFLLISGKLIALHVPPSVYGTYSLQMQLVSLVMSALVSQLLQSMFKFYVQANDKAAYLSHLANLLAWATVPVALVSAFLLVFRLNASHIAVFAAVCYVALFAANGLFRNLYFVQQDQKGFALTNLCQTGGACLVLFCWIRFSSLRVESLWFTQVFPMLGIFVFFFLFARGKHFGEPSHNMPNKDFPLEAVLRYTLPLIPFSILSWINNSVDRFIIEGLLDTRSVGLYSAGYSIGCYGALGLWGLFGNVFRPIMFTQFHADRLAFARTKRRLLLGYTAGSLCLLGSLFLFQDAVGAILLSDVYRDSFSIMFLSAVGYTIAGYLYVSEISFYAGGQTHFLLYHQIVGAVTNVGLNLWLIPVFGIKGAGYATIGSFAAQLVFLQVVQMRMNMATAKAGRFR